MIEFLEHFATSQNICAGKLEKAWQVFVANEFLRKFATLQGISDSALSDAWILWCTKGTNSRATIAQPTSFSRPLGGLKRSLSMAQIHNPPASRMPSRVASPSGTECSGSDNLAQLTNKVLVQMCRDRHLTVSGTKAELVARLNKAMNAAQTQPCLATLIKPKFKFIRDPRTNNLVHYESQLICSETANMIIGRQGDSGEYEQLSADDVQFCKDNGLVWDTNAVKKIVAVSITPVAPLDDSEDSLSDFDE